MIKKQTPIKLTYTHRSMALGVAKGGLGFFTGEPQL